MILKKWSKRIKLVVLLTAILIGSFVLLRWYNSDTVRYRGKYNRTFSFNIYATCSDMGRIMDIGHANSEWEREIYLIKNNLDSIKINLGISRYIGYNINEDTMYLNGKLVKIFVLGNIDGACCGLAVDVDNMKIVDNNYFQKNIWPRQTYNKVNNYPKDYLKLHWDLDK